MKRKGIIVPVPPYSPSREANGKLPLIQRF